MSLPRQTLDYALALLLVAAIFGVPEVSGESLSSIHIIRIYAPPPATEPPHVALLGNRSRNDAERRRVARPRNRDAVAS